LNCTTTQQVEGVSIWGKVLTGEGEAEGDGAREGHSNSHSIEKK